MRLALLALLAGCSNGSGQGPPDLGGSDGAMTDGGGCGPDNHYVVDPAAGNDSAMGGAACPWKTLTHAIAQVGTPAVAVTIDVRGPATLQAPAETVPFFVPANTTISGPAGDPSVTVLAPAGASAFRFAAASSSVQGFAVDGNAKMAMYGIEVGDGASAALDRVTVKDTQLAGINVTGGALFIQSGVTVTAAGMDRFGPRAAGLRVSGTGVVSIRGTTAAPTRFSANTGNGIEVADSGSVEGNTFAAGNCASGSATLTAATTCAGGVDVAVTGAGNTVDAKGCSCATACTP
jgi:hypothetical protein